MNAKTATILSCSFTIIAILVSIANPQQPATGPETEKRFPPLKIPHEFKATLFACDPLIEYPSAIAKGPKQGTLLVAIDYMTGLGRKIIRRDEIRLIQDTNGDGYADKAIVYAKGFNSIQGMTSHDGTVYVMHAPFLTSLRDSDGDGKADKRKDIVKGLGLPPEKNDVRLHCANGLVMGYDGWLYLALGDHGCDVKRPEGDRLVYNGGGILRCRADGSDLHVFATGLRNIYDVALDAELNVFVRDNENDGGQYMVRVCHSFFGADHGYPYLYYERPDEALPPIADLGRGSSAGGLCYLASAFPREYQGNLFFCEWGRAVVRYVPKKSGSGFGPVKEIDFASGAANDPYGFKPTDLALGHDGALFVADWADGQRPKRGRGRIYRIAANSTPAAKKQPGGWQRMRDVWKLALGKKQKAIPRLLQLARKAPAPEVRVQAVRAIADLTDPVLVHHRLNAERLSSNAESGEIGEGEAPAEPQNPCVASILRSSAGASPSRLANLKTSSKPDSGKIAKQLSELAAGQNARVQLEIVIALGRLRWPGAPKWMQKNLKNVDPPLAHAAMQTMRSCRNWPAVFRILDERKASLLRPAAVRAVAEQYEPVIVDGLIKRLDLEFYPKRRREYADALTRIYKKPAQWKYWGYRPAPRPANTVAWVKTEAIAKALDTVLQDPDLDFRHATLKRIQREKIPVKPATLDRWLNKDHDAKRVATILQSLRELPAGVSRPLFSRLIQDKKQAEGNRLQALIIFTAGMDKNAKTQLVQMAKTLDHGPVLAQALRHIARDPKFASPSLFVGKMGSPNAAVRSAAIDSLATLKPGDWRQLVRLQLRILLRDKDSGVRRSAVLALGKLNDKSAADSLLKLGKNDVPAVRAACLESMRFLQDGRAVSLASNSLEMPATQLAALHYLEQFGGPEQASAVTQVAIRNRSIDVLSPAVRMLAKWSEDNNKDRRQLKRMIAQIHGTTGLPLYWESHGPFEPAIAERLRKQLVRYPAGLLNRKNAVIASGTTAQFALTDTSKVKGSVWLAFTDISAPDPGQFRFHSSADGTYRVWLDGKLIHRRKDASSFRPDADQYSAKLSKGIHRILVTVSPSKKNRRFHLRFRRISSKAEHEKLMQIALSRRGNALRGKDVFFNTKKSQCLKCHRLDEKGERIGPDLTGVGKKFARVHLIESILQPSQSVAPSYETVTIVTKKGNVISGTKIEETAAAIKIGDKDGKKHTIVKNTIASRVLQNQSIMPEGLERQFSAQEFVDLIAFLESRK